jgi:hypothetical protein
MVVSKRPVRAGSARASVHQELDKSDNIEGASIIGDKAYTDYRVEDMLNEAGIHLLPFRKKNSKRLLPPWVRYLQACYRKVIETTASLVERLLPKSIHAITAQGFELKVALFVLACSFSYLG